MAADVFGLKNFLNDLRTDKICINTSMSKFKLPFTIIKKRSHDSLVREHSILASIVDLYTKADEEEYKSTAGCIIFSMDRALQLHALLASYYEKVKHPAPVHILYRTTSEAHQAAYNDVFSMFNSHPLSITAQISQESFKVQLISILESCRTAKVFFLVDDIVFTENTDMHDFTRIDTRTAVASLRMGTNLTRAYTVQQSQKLPSFIADHVFEKDKLCWIWEKGELDWGYPLSVDGHLFSTRELLILAKHIYFNSPNTFEANLQQYNRYFKRRYGVSYKKSRILNIPLNKVQNDNANIHGEVHQDYLLEQWNRGLQMNYRALFGFVNESAHQEVPITFIKRS